MCRLSAVIWFIAHLVHRGSCEGATETGRSQPPNVVVILADDMGWNDVSFHGSDQIPTPNIDALAYNGLILNQHYTPALCTPSRSALLTGKYPIHTGMQHMVILENEPWGLPLDETVLPQHLSKAGYRSHAVGKWHLGFFKKEYTPTYRGFESHYGYYQGFHDYYNHSTKATYDRYDGYDFRRNLDTDWSAHGRYSTELFTEEAVRIIKTHDTRDPLFLYLAHLAPHTGNMRDPFQAPDNVVVKFAHIQDPERRTYAAMVSKLDESVGDVVAALKDKGMLQNSIIVFMSDNGAPTWGVHSNRGSNYPFRGIKDSAWEGGMRCVAAVWSPLIKKPQRVVNQLMYMTDWLPTFYSLAGLDPKELGNIDGHDMWGVLSEDRPSPRREVLYNIDDKYPYAAIRVDDWKYITGSTSGVQHMGWYGETGRESGIKYDPETVLMSRAGVAISAHIIKQKILQNIRERVSNDTSFRGYPEIELLDEAKIWNLRRDAVVRCGGKTANLTYAECRPLESPCLFNLAEDPCEMENLAETNRSVLIALEDAIRRYRTTMRPALNQPGDVTADPNFWNNTWTFWLDEMESQQFTKALDSPQFLYYATALLASVALLAFFYPVYSTTDSTDKKSVSAFSFRSKQEND